jgi:Ca2+-binding EF-hand superfamily protein
VTAWFEAADEDANGILSEEEWEGVIKETFEVNLDMARALWQGADGSDGTIPDEELSLAEVEYMYAVWEYDTWTDVCTIVFTSTDADDNGGLDADEWDAAVASFNGTFVEEFTLKGMDVNKDGFVTLDEWLDVIDNTDNEEGYADYKATLFQDDDSDEE